MNVLYNEIEPYAVAWLRNLCERGGSGWDAGALPRAEEDARRGVRRVPHELALAGDAVRGFWFPADWIICTDGKTRPVEPDTFPLAHGAPARVGRLRAYGNAIVKPLAEIFIASVMDVLGLQ